MVLHCAQATYYAVCLSLLFSQGGLILFQGNVRFISAFSSESHESEKGRVLHCLAMSLPYLRRADGADLSRLGLGMKLEA